MVDLDTFVTILYVLVDDFCRRCVPPDPPRPGPAASLSRSEVVTLAIVGQWAQFRSERAFYRYARKHLGAAFPTLPHRGQFNRLLRRHQDTITRFGLWLAQEVEGQTTVYEVVDCTAAATRNAKRRGWGWLVGQTAIGWSNRLGWYEGFKTLLSVTRRGTITGFVFGAANTDDRAMAEALFAMRAQPHERVPSAGAALGDYYIADAGFFGRARLEDWTETYGLRLVVAPQGKKHRWSRAFRRWFASIRQIIETVNDWLLEQFRLDRERPHALSGFSARLAAKVALHNFCLWLNQSLGRPSLAVADLIDW